MAGGIERPNSRVTKSPNSRFWSCRFAHASRVPFFFRQWGGVQKSRAGRALDGRTYDAFPLERGADVPSRGADSGVSQRRSA